MLILVQFTIEPLWKLGLVINELSVKVLDTPLHLTLVSMARRMTKLSEL
jgi:hypothetical protein